MQMKSIHKSIQINSNNIMQIINQFKMIITNQFMIDKMQIINEYQSEFEIQSDRCTIALGLV